MQTETTTKPVGEQWFPIPPGNPAVRRLHRSAINDPKEVVKIMSEDGAVIIEGFLQPGQVASFNADIAPHLSNLKAGSKYDNEEMQTFHGNNTKRLSNLVSLSKTFREEILDNNLVYEICDEFFRGIGDYWLSTAQSMAIGPGNPRQPLHRDQGNWFPTFIMGPSAPEVSISFLVAQTDTTEKNGATLAIPKSHLWPFGLDNPNNGGYDAASVCELKAGDALLIGGKIVHSGGANRTDKFRTVTTIVFCSCALSQEEAFKLILDRELVKTLSERVKKVLGYRTVFPLGTPGMNTVNNGDIKGFLGW
ncbi:phytanoyl dioxygenase [Fusarium phyllophilum]|uniref:Phytanoyl dioxygenase n=1 Tax=Fusarium phyllophilum TaxID=47803 RepID=A0A8H5MLQ9_9HYPO|nr:phytanoyl dioxygenase [Fusarium phyllophilum]